MITREAQDVPVGQLPGRDVPQRPEEVPTSTQTAPAADQIVGITQIAERLGVKPNTASIWRMKDPTFPKPRYKVSRDDGYWWPEIEAWAKEHGKIPSDG